MQKDILVNFRARYFQSNEPSEHIKNVYFVCHGHGMLAYYFLKKFEGLFDSETIVVAPEGLSRYYLDGFSGRVGATWMTKEERLTDIHNYVTYLDTVYQEVINHCPNARITLLGFSQGSATASRWLMHGKNHFDRLILWAGIFPPDLPFELSEQKLKDTEITFVYGQNDPYLSEQKMNELRDITSKLGVQTKEMVFDGAHEIDSETLLKFKN
ncbi:alpha/beta hydrolase [Peijinzhouia sedimentorum]